MTHDSLINSLYKHQDGFADLEQRYDIVDADAIDDARDMYDRADFERVVWMNLSRVGLFPLHFDSLDAALDQVSADVHALRYLQAVPAQSESAVRPTRDALQELINRHVWYDEQRYGALADQVNSDNSYVKRRAEAQVFALSLVEDGYDLLPASL